MSKLDPRIEEIRARYSLDAADFWQIPQNKQWVCKHAALEVVATKANVEWSLPQIIQADTGNGIAVLAVSGKMGDRSEWATGEASPKNNKNSYPWAMAEKRAKDRVILKLVGIHGLVYSEDEMPAVEPRTTDQRSEQGRRETQRQAANQSGQLSKEKARPIFATLQDDMRRNKTKPDMARWLADPDVAELRSQLPKDWNDNLRSMAKQYYDSLPAEARPEDQPSMMAG